MLASTAVDAATSFDTSFATPPGMAPLSASGVCRTVSVEDRAGGGRTELWWDFEMLVSRVELAAAPSDVEREFRVTCQRGGETYGPWHEIGRVVARPGPTDRPMVFVFDPVRTRRLRVECFDPSDPSKPMKDSNFRIGAYGPPQPLVALDRNGRASGGAWSADGIVVFSDPHGNRVEQRDHPRDSARVTNVAITPRRLWPDGEARLALTIEPEGTLSADYVFVVVVGEKNDGGVPRSDYTIARLALRHPQLPTRWTAPVTLRASIPVPSFAPDGQLDARLVGLSPGGGANLELKDAGGASLGDGKIGVIDIDRFGKDKKKAKKQRDRPAPGKAEIVDGRLLIDGRRVAPIVCQLERPSFESAHLYRRETGLNLFHVWAGADSLIEEDGPQRRLKALARQVENILRIDPTARFLVEVETGPYDVENDLERTKVLLGVEEFILRLGGKPWADRVIGYTLSGHPTAPIGKETDNRFRAYLRKQYGDVERLRRAYQDPTVDFEKLGCFSSYRWPRRETERFFADPRLRRPRLDALGFLPTMHTYYIALRWSKNVRDLTDGRALVGATKLYGPRKLWHFPHSTNDYRSLDYYLFDPVRDLPYGLGNLESFRLSGRSMLFAAANDFATQAKWTLIRGAGCFIYFDPQTKPARTKQSYVPQTADLRDVTETSRLRDAIAKGPDRAPRAASDVAIFYDERLYACLSRKGGNIMWDLRRNIHEIGQAGASCDLLLLSDVLRPEVRRRYRLCVFLNAFHPTEAEWRAILSMKSEGRTLLWFYAPGYVTGDGFTTEGVGRVVGMPVRGEDVPFRAIGGEDSESGAKHVFEFRFEGDHPIVGGLAPGGAVKWPSDKPTASPRFVIDASVAGATALGSYKDGATAFAVREFASYSSVYCAGSFLPEAVYRNLMKYAGVHVYCDDSVAVDANDDWLAVTNPEGKDERDIELRLPTPRRVVDFVNDETVAAEPTTRFRTRLAAGETKVFRLE